MYSITYHTHHPHKVMRKTVGLHPLLEHATAVLDHAVHSWPTAPNPPVEVTRNGGGRVAALFSDGRVLVLTVERAA